MVQNFDFVDLLGNRISVEAEEVDRGKEIAAHRLALNNGKHLIFLVDDVRSSWEKFFTPDTDVVEVVGTPEYGVKFNLFQNAQIKGYDLVHLKKGGGYYDRATGQLSDPVRQLIIRIPKNGQVHCPKRFMGRVIGKKGVKINELSKKHGVKIKLIEIPD